MRVLVTGAAGFAGRHLARELLRHNHEVIALDLTFDEPIEGVTASYSADLCNADAVSRVVAASAPDGCVHLGGIAFVPSGKVHPEKVLSINTLGTVNLLDAFKEYASTARIVSVTSAQIYSLSHDQAHYSEESPVAPVGVYSISKAAADMATLAYADKYGMHTMTARPNNHTGPGQSPKFVVSAFARQVKAIARGKAEPIMRVGNLDSRRVFSDVRDVAKAYRLILEKGRMGLAYNISSLDLVTIRSVLDRLCEIEGISPEITVAPDKFRPTDSSPLANIDRIQEHTGWKPDIPLEQTLRDMLAAL